MNGLTFTLAFLVAPMAITLLASRPEPVRPYDWAQEGTL